ncbi:MAG: MOSC domain-containing protein [Candidatus Marinimicrobia bacterium]|nr:MOSC domain-containing protein [Candidatus Neomarinimicrobiota bacterium]
MTSGNIFQINVKPSTPGEHGLPKKSVPFADIHFGGVDGDYNNFRQEKKKGDPVMAILVLPIEIINNLNHEGWPVNSGDLGENLTTSGISHSEFSPGQQDKAGKAVIEISFECDPCKNLSVLPCVGETKINFFMKTLMNRRGWYAKVIQPGTIYAGELITKI